MHNQRMLELIVNHSPAVVICSSPLASGEACADGNVMTPDASHWMRVSTATVVVHYNAGSHMSACAMRSKGALNSSIVLALALRRRFETHFTDRGGHRCLRFNGGEEQRCSGSRSEEALGASQIAAGPSCLRLDGGKEQRCSGPRAEEALEALTHCGGAQSPSRSPTAKLRPTRSSSRQPPEFDY